MAGNCIVTSPKPLNRSFYARDAIHLAPELIGKILVRRFGQKTLRARIVETEAYVGEHDLACHAARRADESNGSDVRPAGVFLRLLHLRHVSHAEFVARTWTTRRRC
jgi:3-methyladenine DNA glycosylase Mpg